jgi:hypothetical protein
MEKSPFPPIAHDIVEGLESSMCDAAYMAAVNATILEASIGGPKDAEIHKGFVMISNKDVEELLFCAYHLDEMIRALKEKYYELLDGHVLRTEDAPS